MYGCVLALSLSTISCGNTNNGNDGSAGAGNAQVEVTDENDTNQDADSTDEKTETPEDVNARQTAKVDQLAEPVKGETVATMKLKGYGTIKMRFFPDAAPKAVENFITHAKDGYYDGVTFHRVINDFMIQGGDPDGTGMGGESIWGNEFQDEINKYLIPLRGALCMANAGGGNTNGSQFFIVQSDAVDSTDKEQLKNGLAQYLAGFKDATRVSLDAYDDSVIDNYLKTGGCMFLSGGYTVFGQVFDGIDVVDKIAATATDGADKPLEDVIIESIDISEYKG